MFFYQTNFLKFKLLFFGIVLRNVVVHAANPNGQLEIGDNYIKPVLDHTQDHYVLSSSERWKIRCIGSAPLAWSYPNCGSDKANESRIQITSEELDTQYISFLEIPDLKYFDTGYYICYYQESYLECDEDLHDQDDVAATYLYASDPENLLTLGDRVSNNSKTFIFSYVIFT